MKMVSWRRALLFIVIAAAFYFVLIVLSDLDKVGEAASQFKWTYIVPAIALVTANYIVRAERWHIFLRSVGLPLPRRRSYWLFICGFAMLFTPGKVGEAVKALLLKVEKDAPIERGVAIVFAERVTDIVGLIVLIGVGSFAIAFGLVSFGVIVVLVAALLVILQSERVGTALASWLERRKRFSKLGGMLRVALADARQLLRGKNLLVGSSMAVLGWSLECLGFYLILRGCSVDVSVLEAIFIYTFSLVIGAISMLPGGMGTTEATMVGLLTTLETSASVASFAVILMRVSALWLGVSVGVVSLAIYSKGNMGAEGEAPAA